MLSGLKKTLLGQEGRWDSEQGCADRIGARSQPCIKKKDGWLGARGREEEAGPGQGPLSPLQEGVCRQGGSAGRQRDASLLLNLLFFQNQMSKRDFPSSPVVKALPSSAGGSGVIPGRGARIPHVSWPKDQNIKQKQYGNKFSEDFKNGPH